MTKFAVALILLFFEVGLAQLVMDRPEYCKCHPRHGPCQAHFPSYYYNVNTGRCEFFVYGGCRGNKNRFPSKEECEDVCKAEIRGENYENVADNNENYENVADNYENYDNMAENHENRDIRESCSQDPDVGPCLARIPHYYFNQDTYTCELFYYGGCGGNANNFRTIEECKLTCLAEFY